MNAGAHRATGVLRAFFLRGTNPSVLLTYHPHAFTQLCQDADALAGKNYPFLNRLAASYPLSSAGVHLLEPDVLLDDAT